MTNEEWVDTLEDTGSLSEALLAKRNKLYEMYCVLKESLETGKCLSYMDVAAYNRLLIDFNLSKKAEIKSK